VSQQIADLLERAADHIEKNGWTKYLLQSGNRVCALGSMMRAMGNQAHWYDQSSEDRQLIAEASKALVKHLGLYQGVGASPEHAVASWNNNQVADVQELLDGFRLAAKKEAMADV
jgi:hypothetical protein